MATRQCGVIGISESGKTVYLSAVEMGSRTVRINRKDNRLFLSSKSLRASLTRDGSATNISRIYRILNELFDASGGRE